MSRRKLSRRTALRSLAVGVGASVALPALDIMVNSNGTSYADGEAFPLRHGIFFWGNGVRPDRWLPERTGARWWEQSREGLMPIASRPAIRDRVNVLSDFSYQIRSGTAHHVARAQIIAGAYEAGAGGACCGRVSGPSADWLTRSAWAGESARLDALDIGISRQNKGGTNFSINRGLVYDDNGDSRPLEMSPRAAFERLFGDGLPDGAGDLGNTEAVRAARRSVVDQVRGDAARLRTKLGVSDQRRLDEHMSLLRAVERNIDSFESASACTIPDMMPGTSEAYQQDNIPITRDGRPQQITGELLTEKNEIMSQLVALALACDLTRVFTYQHHGMQTDTMFHMLPGVSLGHHQSTHDDRTPNFADQFQDFEAVHQIATYTMNQFAVLLESLAGIPEGDGDLLDRSIIFATSEYADASRHDLGNMAMLTAGLGCGRFKGGHHLRGGGRNPVDVQLAILQGVGLEIDGFGRGAARSTAAFDDLYA